GGEVQQPQRQKHAVAEGVDDVAGDEQTVPPQRGQAQRTGPPAGAAPGIRGDCDGHGASREQILPRTPSLGNPVVPCRSCKTLTVWASSPSGRQRTTMKVLQD